MLSSPILIVPRARLGIGHTRPARPRSTHALCCPSYGSTHRSVSLSALWRPAKSNILAIHSHSAGLRSRIPRQSSQWRWFSSSTSSNEDSNPSKASTSSSNDNIHDSSESSKNTSAYNRQEHKTASSSQDHQSPSDSSSSGATVSKESPKFTKDYDGLPFTKEELEIMIRELEKERRGPASSSDQEGDAISDESFKLDEKQLDSLFKELNSVKRAPKAFDAQDVYIRPSDVDELAKIQEAEKLEKERLAALQQEATSSKWAGKQLPPTDTAARFVESVPKPPEVKKPRDSLTRGSDKKEQEEEEADPDGRPRGWMRIVHRFKRLASYSKENPAMALIGVLLLLPALLTWAFDPKIEEDEGVPEVRRQFLIKPRWTRLDYTWCANRTTETMIFEMCATAALAALPPINPITTRLDSVRGDITPLYPKDRQSVTPPTFWKLRIDFPSPKKGQWEMADRREGFVQAASPDFPGAQFMWILCRTWERGEPMIRVLMGGQVGGTIKSNPWRSLIPWRRPVFRPRRLSNPLFRPLELDTMFTQLYQEKTRWYKATKAFGAIPLPDAYYNVDWDLTDTEYEMLEVRGYGDYLYNPNSVEWPGNYTVIDPLGVGLEESDEPEALAERYGPVYSPGRRSLKAYGEPYDESDLPPGVYRLKDEKPGAPYDWGEDEEEEYDYDDYDENAADDYDYDYDDDDDYYDDEDDDSWAKSRGVTVEDDPDGEDGKPHRRFSWIEKAQASPEAEDDEA